MLQDLIEAINEHQQRKDLHPLTCGNDSRHRPLLAKEENGKAILVCEDCDYVQRYIPEVFEEIVEEIVEENESTHCPGCGQYPEDCECDSGA